MKHKILLATAFVFALATILTLTKLVFADSTGNLLPIADGTYSEWITYPANVPPYTTVDESLCNSDTDVNYTGTIGARDSYEIDISSVPNGATINSITITPCVSTNLFSAPLAPEPTKMGVFYRYNGVNSFDFGNYSLQTDSNQPSLRPPTVFNGLNLVKQAGSSLEVGAVYLSGPGGLKLSQMMASVSFTSTPTSTPPTVGATSVFSTTRTSTNFYSYVNPNGTSTTGWFRYGSTSPGTCNDTFGTRVPAIGGVNLGNGSSPVQYFYYNAPLSPDTIYYYCAIANNSLGTRFGSLKSFKTPL